MGELLGYPVDVGTEAHPVISEKVEPPTPPSTVALA
jgi:hypothetical protein